MKIKYGTTVQATDDGYVFNTEFARRGKITSRVLPNLLGKNSFTSVGESILERFGFLEKGHFEKWYSVRGRVGELLARQYIELFLNHKQIEYKKIHAYELQMFEGFDMFHPSYKHGHDVFGGTPDMLVEKEDRKDNLLIEVKTKNIGSYNYIVNVGNLPEEELMQAHYLGYMTKSKEFALTYVFFTDEQEAKIRDITEDADNLSDEELLDRLGFSLVGKDKVVVTMAIRNVDRDYMEGEMEKAKKILDEFQETGLLSKDILSAADVLEIENYIEESSKGINEDMFVTF